MNSRLNRFSQLMPWNGFRNSGGTRADDPSSEQLEKPTTLTVVRRFVVQRPGAAIMAGLVVGGMLGWLVSRNK